MLGLYALLSVLSNQPSEWRKNLFSIEAVPCFNVLPLQAQLGLFFLFCLSSVSLDSPLSERRLYSFLSSGVFRLPWIRPQLPHPAPTGPVTRLAGVVPLPGPQNRTQGCTGPSFGFLPRTRLPLPLKGEGLGITFLGLVGSALFVQNWITLAQQGRLCSLLAYSLAPVFLDFMGFLASALKCCPSI